MNSLQIRYFLHLCGTGSISETARQLFVAQPAVSKQIAALERELGFPLFLRTNRGVTRTAGGELLYRFLDPAEQEFRRVRAQAEQLMRRQRPRLALGILENLGLDELQKVIAGLQQAHPELALTLARLDNSTLMEQLSDGRLDAVITFDHAMEGRAGVAYTELALEQSLFIISRDHPLAGRTDIPPRALFGQLFCETRSRQGADGDGYLRRLTALLGIRPAGFLPVDNLASGLAAVETNQAVGLIDERAQLLHPERYRLIPSGTYQSVVCAWLEGNRNPHLPKLVQHLKAACAGPGQAAPEGEAGAADIGTGAAADSGADGAEPPAPDGGAPKEAEVGGAT